MKIIDLYKNNGYKPIIPEKGKGYSTYVGLTEVKIFIVNLESIGSLFKAYFIPVNNEHDHILKYNDYRKGRLKWLLINNRIYPDNPNFQFKELPNKEIKPIKVKLLAGIL